MFIINVFKVFVLIIIDVNYLYYYYKNFRYERKVYLNFVVFLVDVNKEFLE